MTKILFALAIFIFSGFSWRASASPEPDLVFQCGQDFQRELTRISNNEFMISEGFAHSLSTKSSRAYFFVSNSEMGWSKNKCKMELTARIVDGPQGRVEGKRAAYKFQFQFLKKNGPTSLVFVEEGKASVSCTVSPKFLTRFESCQLPLEIPEAMVCKSPMVEGTQVKTIFRYDAMSGVSERQVYKITKDITPREKEEDLGIRGTKLKWKMKNKVCELGIQEKEENQDQWLDFQMKFDRKLGASQNGYFNKMRILLDREHVADLLDNKKSVQCAVSAPFLAESTRCTDLNSASLRQPTNAGKAKVDKKKHRI